jgi:hypothetical protein
MRKISVIVGLGLGVAITPLAITLAIISGGAGHGHYEFARALFPYTMLLTRVSGDTITMPLIVLALAQFPTYGAVIGACSHRHLAVILVGATLLFAHTLVAVFCFSGIIPNFS